MSNIAADIIDAVEDKILKAHPEIEEIVKKCKGNTLLYGEAYYELEDWINNLIKKQGGGE